MACKALSRANFGVRIFIAFLAVLLIPTLITGAEISGRVYDFTLDPAEKAIVEVNSTPKQSMLAVDGTYTFTLPQGEYLIKAYQSVEGNYETTEEIITVRKNGTFVLDLFLIPELESDELLLRMDEIEVEDNKAERPPMVWISISAMTLILVILLIIYAFKAREGSLFKGYAKERAVAEREEVDKLILSHDTEETPHHVKEIPLEEQIIGVMKKEEMMTQKELRKRFPLSEAKVSLVLTDLEARGIIQKVKKGRANILKYVGEKAQKSTTAP